MNRLFEAVRRRLRDAVRNRRVRADGGTAEGAADRLRESPVPLPALDGDGLRSAPFWLPTTLLMGLFVYGAILWNLVISLTDWSGLGDPSYSSIDLSQYAELFAGFPFGPFWQTTFGHALKNTLVLLVAFTVVSLALGLVLAILVDQDIRLENTIRTVYLLPMSLSFVVTALFWQWMYNFNFGLINELLRLVGLGVLAQKWISDPQFKLAAVTFALMWQFSGYCMVVYLAGLRAIPDEHYEAARVDGASTLKMYWRIIVPQLRSSTMSAAVVLMVFALKAFDFLFVMFGKTPGPSVDILSLMMYREAFVVGDWAEGSAIAMVLFLMALGVIAPYVLSQYRRGEL
jgi:glucose/mannose transport system permease protein